MTGAETSLLNLLDEELEKQHFTTDPTAARWLKKHKKQFVVPQEKVEKLTKPPGTIISAGTKYVTGEGEGGEVILLAACEQTPTGLAITRIEKCGNRWIKANLLIPNIKEA